MRKGGYKIIDFKGKTLSGTKTVIPGIYEAIEGTDKAIMASGVVISTTEFKDEFVPVELSSGDYLITPFHGYAITITDDDEVTAEAITSTKKGTK